MTNLFASVKATVKEFVANCVASIHSGLRVAALYIRSINRLGSTKTATLGKQGCAWRTTAWMTLENAWMLASLPFSGTWLSAGERVLAGRSWVLRSAAEAHVFRKCLFYVGILASRASPFECVCLGRIGTTALDPLMCAIKVEQPKAHLA
jgi:hypothetical protein